MSLFKILGLAIRDPARFKVLIDAIKGTQLYANIVVARALQAQLNKVAELPEKKIALEEFMQQNNFRNKSLLLELLALLEKDGYVKIKKDDFVILKKQIVEEELKKREKKVAPIVLDAFEAFGDYTERALIERLEGVPPASFDSNELRVLWNVALRGDFYTIQRRDALNFAQLDKLAKRNQNQPIRILDFGCGSGEGTIQILTFLREKNIPHNLEACDISEGLLEIAAEDEALEEDIYFFNYKERKPKEGYYDAIFISQVLHWPDDPVQMVSDLKSYLKENGILFGVQSTFSKRLYQIDLFIRLLGAKGFPEEKEFYRWFEENDMNVRFDPATYTFLATKKK